MIHVYLTNTRVKNYVINVNYFIITLLANDLLKRYHAVIIWFEIY